MSGIEIVGLVLGAYPVLLSTAKDLRIVFEDVETWWCFEREFEDFVSSVEEEHITYSLNLQFLLQDLEIPEEDKERLQIDSNSSGWHNVQTQAELRRRIQDRHFHWFMRQLAAMNKALGDLEGLLQVEKTQHMSPSSLEKEIFRLKTSFTHRKDSLLAEVRHRNDKITKFLQQASHLSGTATSTQPQSSSKQTTSLLALQSDALALYESFQSHLRCKCTSDHSCGITVSGKGDLKDQVTAGHLRMLFWDGPCRIQVKILSVSAPGTNNRAPPRPATDKLEEVSSVRQRLSAKNRLEAARKGAPKSLFTLAASSISVFGSLSLGKPRKSLGKPQDQTKRLLDFGWPLRTSKKEAAEKKATAPTPTVRFADGPLSEATAQSCSGEGTTVIKDLCQAIKPSTRSTDVAHTFKLGYLESRERRRLMLNLDPENQKPLQSFHIDSLQTFVKDTPRRDARLKVGRDLILAILSLGNSSWTPATWTATDLFLVRDPARPIPQPYFRHDSLRDSLRSNDPNSTGTQTQASLFTLGVLLLELIFRDQLENQPCRAELMGSDRKPTATTDLATALTWQRKVEEELGFELADAIKRCLVCMFDQAATPDLGNARFVQAVCQQVVRPIESFISAWNRN